MNGADQSEQGEADIELLRQHIAILLEHFDTVHIFVSKHDGVANQTETTQAGRGNFYARYGQIRAWLLRSDDEEVNNGEE